MNGTRTNGSTALLDRSYPEILSVTPASGVWAVYLGAGTEGNARFGREPVLVWALVRSPDGVTDVVAMIGGDGAGLDFLDESFRWLWSEASNERCRCGYVNPPAFTVSDPWWCRVCAADHRNPALSITETPQLTSEVGGVDASLRDSQAVTS